MERYRPKPLVREYAPGVTNPEVFSNLVTSNPYYRSGIYKTERGKELIRSRLEKLDEFLTTKTTGSKMIWGVGIEKFWKTEKAVLEEISLQGELASVT